ncbi:hypothetical protein HOY80DRAFT_210445 [Tuber brumale]|nr:hypothetical protein HOY80DRAFT_210445 [Tuber brumale]
MVESFEVHAYHKLFYFFPARRVTLRIPFDPRALVSEWVMFLITSVGGYKLSGVTYLHYGGLWMKRVWCGKRGKRREGRVMIQVIATSFYFILYIRVGSCFFLSSFFFVAWLANT